MIQKRSKTVMISTLICMVFGAFNLAMAAESAKSLVNTAVEHFIQKEYDAAIDYASRAIKLNPKYASAYYVIAISEVKKSNLESALINIEKAIEFDRLNYEYHLEKANILKKLGRWEEATEVAESTYRFFPEAVNLAGLAWSHYITAEKYKYKNRTMANLHYNKALKFYSKEIELHPQEMFSYRGRAYVYLAMDPPDFTSAEKDYKKVLELAPSDYEGYVNLADLYIKQDRYTDAFNVISSGLKKVSRPSPLLVKRAGFYVLMNRPEEAIKDLNRVLNLGVFKIESRYSGWTIDENFIRNVLKELANKNTNKQKEAVRTLIIMTIHKDEYRN